MAERHTGIVLQTDSSRKKTITILDKEHGAVRYIADAYFCVGAFLQYHIIKRNNLVLMTGSEQIALPLKLAKHDILFLHHVLELCYYFLAQNSPAPEVFDHLAQLYRSEEHLPFSSVLKKLFLVRLFLLFGIYPEDRNFKVPFLYYGAQSLVDMTAKEFVDLKNESILDAWLHSCIAMHPRSSLFKTVHFLTEK